MIVIHTTILEGNWKKSLPKAEKLIARALTAAAQKAKVKKGEVTVALADDKTIRVSNKHFRQKDKPTNVLSFPAPTALKKQGFLGDVIVSLSTLKREAKDQKKTLEAHFVHLIVHGFLHLLGYDHERDSDAVEMERKEVLILAGLGYDNPYEERE